MIDFEKLGRDFWSARFTLDVAVNNIAGDNRIAEGLSEDHLETLGMADAKLKVICDRIAKASGAFCDGYTAANREAIENGRKWSEDRAEKIALLRLAGDDTPEEQIPI